MPALIVSNPISIPKDHCLLHTWMHSQGIYVVPILLDNLLQNAKLDAKNHSEFAPGIQVVGPVVLVIQLFETAEVDVRACHAVDFGGLEDDAGGGRVGELGGVADEGEEEVEGVELATDGREGISKAMGTAREREGGSV